MKIEKLTKNIEVYMNIARQISTLSHDTQTQVGAILISINGNIIATGYNGFVRGASDYLLPKVRPHKHLFMQHAERNLLYNCLNEGISTKGGTIVCTLSPCLECLRACYQSGIKMMVFDEYYSKINHPYYDKIPDINVSIIKIPSKDKTYTGLMLNEGKSLCDEYVLDRLSYIKD